MEHDVFLRCTAYYALRFHIEHGIYEEKAQFIEGFGGYLALKYMRKAYTGCQCAEDNLPITQCRLISARPSVSYPDTTVAVRQE